MTVATLKKPEESYAVMGFTLDGFFSGAFGAPAEVPFENIVHSIKPIGLRFAVILGQDQVARP